MHKPCIEIEFLWILCVNTVGETESLHVNVMYFGSDHNVQLYKAFWGKEHYMPLLIYHINVVT